MGFSPDQVGRMSPWQFMACLDQHARKEGWQLNGGGKAMSLDRLRELGIE